MSDKSVRHEATKKSFLKESAWLRFSSPLVSTLLRASAADSEMLELGSAARPGQPEGLLFPIVAHYLLLKAPDPSLARFFPSLTSQPDPVEEAFSVFREFCLDRREEFTDLLSRRTVNTNLVERSSCILPTLAYVGRVTHEPLTLVEICCSSGMSLQFDQYHYDYGPVGQLGADHSPVHLNCKVIGSSRPPIEAIPQVAERVGVDLVTIDPLDPLERLWMEAAVYPEWLEERGHLRGALALRATHPIRMIMGDALEVLPSLLEGLPGSPCVLHSYCLAQWTEAGKRELDDVLRRASRNRDIHRIGLDSPERESPGTIRGRLGKLAAAGVPLRQKSLPSYIEHTWYVKHGARTRVLGQADGFGGWIDWQGVES